MSNFIHKKSYFRLRPGTTWGIAIDVNAKWCSIKTPPQSAKQLSRRIWFSSAATNILFFVSGLKSVSEQIESRQEGLIHIRLLELDYNPTDYQVEGLTPAAACWAAEAFGFAKPQFTAVYDQQKRKYIISMSEDTPMTSVQTVGWLKQRIKNLPDNMPLYFYSNGCKKPVNVLQIGERCKEGILASEEMPDIAQLIADGKKIEAIKTYRQLTGLGLKEAKDYIDGLMIGVDSCFNRPQPEAPKNVILREDKDPRSNSRRV